MSVVFIGRTESSGAWYTTGRGLDSDSEESTVTTCSFDKQSFEYNGLLNAFAYLLEAKPEIKQRLKSCGSEILKILEEHKKRRTKK